jgi:hypothetical protein
MNICKAAIIFHLQKKQAELLLIDPTAANEARIVLPGECAVITWYAFLVALKALLPELTGQANPERAESTWRRHGKMEGQPRRRNLGNQQLPPKRRRFFLVMLAVVHKKVEQAAELLVQAPLTRCESSKQVQSKARTVGHRFIEQLDVLLGAAMAAVKPIL